MSNMVNGKRSNEEANFQFNINERVLCFHCKLLYDAKILNQRSNDTDVEYYIHYSGWGKRYDEWVPEFRVLKYTDETERRQNDHDVYVNGKSTLGNYGFKKGRKLIGKDSKNTKGQQNNGKSSTIETTSNVSSSGDNLTSSLNGGGNTSTQSRKSKSISASHPLLEATNGKKRKLLLSVESEEKFNLKQAIHISIPEELAVILQQDFDHIVRQKRLVKIPGNWTIDSVFEHYKTTDKFTKTEITSSILTALKEYFNFLLPYQLLYPFETEQFIQMGEESVLSEEEYVAKLTSIYGPIHLLRLFSRIGTIIPFTKMAQVQVRIVQLFISNLQKYCKIWKCSQQETYQI